MLFCMYKLSASQYEYDILVITSAA